MIAAEAMHPARPASGGRGVSLPRHRKSSLLDLRTIGGEIA
jgi:hypothetical protein